MESTLLSRVCSKRITRALADLAKYGGEPECVRLHFVREGLIGGQRSDVSHVVLTWEGTSGIRAAARFCMCGQIEDPYYGSR
jgi:hypothetical protein